MTDDSPSAPIDLSSLEAEWRRRDWRTHLNFLDDHLVTLPGGDPFYDPYLPWVGPDYRAGGVLLYATAQNIGQFQPGSAEWKRATGWPDRTLRRLERSIHDWRDVPIQPWMDGILAALAGLWMIAREGDAPAELADITRRVAVTNYFKQSLGKRGPTGINGDLNPTKLPSDLLGQFVATTKNCFVLPEIAHLRPGIVMGLKTIQDCKGLTDIPARTVTANDPSWVKQGMSGVARPGGSWRQRVDSSSFPSGLEARLESWLGQLGSPYSTGKREATRVYLLCTFLELAD